MKISAPPSSRLRPSSQFSKLKLFISLLSARGLYEDHGERRRGPQIETEKKGKSGKRCACSPRSELFWIAVLFLSKFSPSLQHWKTKVMKRTHRETTRPPCSFTPTAWLNFETWSLCTPTEPRWERFSTSCATAPSCVTNEFCPSTLLPPNERNHFTPPLLIREDGLLKSSLTILSMYSIWFLFYCFDYPGLYQAGSVPGSC